MTERIAGTSIYCLLVKTDSINCSMFAEIIRSFRISLSHKKSKTTPSGCEILNSGVKICRD